MDGWTGHRDEYYCNIIYGPPIIGGGRDYKQMDGKGSYFKQYNPLQSFAHLHSHVLGIDVRLRQPMKTLHVTPVTMTT